MNNENFIDTNVSILDVSCWTCATRIKKMINQEPEVLFKYMINLI